MWLTAAARMWQQSDRTCVGANAKEQSLLLLFFKKEVFLLFIRRYP
jgi:hypothetical protein